MAVKKKDHEKLDAANIEAVILLLEQDKPISIKDACERLNIAANGPRLKKIIQEFKDNKEADRQRRAANRGKPATEHEIASIIEDYLGGESLKAIADGLYRSTDFVKRVVDEVGIPQAGAGDNYVKFAALPEQCMSDTFEVGEFVWSSTYGAIAEVDKDMGPSSDELSNVYRIYVHQRIDEDKSLVEGKRFSYHVTKGGGFYAHKCAYDLGSLKHLSKYGVDVKRAIK